MRPLLYAVCAFALFGGMLSGCNDKAKADVPYLGEYIGSTSSGVVVVRFQDNTRFCYVAVRDRGLVSPPAISCTQ